MRTESPLRLRSNSFGLSGLKQMNSTSSSFGRPRNILTARSSSFSSIKNTQGKLGTLRE